MSSLFDNPIYSLDDDDELDALARPTTSSRHSAPASYTSTPTTSTPSTSTPTTPSITTPGESNATTPRANGEVNVQVVCRFRPDNVEEIREGGYTCVEYSDNGEDGKLRNVKIKHVVEDTNSSTPPGTSEFTFDRIFSPYSSQDELFTCVGVPITNSVMSGINSCVIAYGQTGSGKTYTMLGPGFDGNTSDTKSSDERVLGDPGLIPRIMQSIFSQVSVLESDTMVFQIRASYIEIWCEKVRDLLAPDPVDNRERIESDRKSMSIRVDTQRGLWIPDATEVPVANLMQVFSVLRMGAKKRKQSATASNENSSRSHAILIVTILRRDLATRVEKLSQLYLVDLAGSEKIEKSKVMYQSLEEAKKINQGLLSLGNVIFALAGAKKKSYIPYRDSKLTRLLQNCIGGDARTTLVINCSPNSYNARETLSTLKFGDKAKRIRNKPRVHEHVSVAELRAMLQRERSETARLRGMLRQMEIEARVMREMWTFEQQAMGGDGQQQQQQQQQQQKRIAWSDVSDHKSIDGSESSDEKSSDSNTSHTSTLSSSSSSSTDDMPSFMKQIQTTSGPLYNMSTTIQTWSERTNGENKFKTPGLRELVLHFLCPLSKQIMLDPVIALDGWTYDRRAIESYLKAHACSPMTGQPMGILLIPNRNLHQQINKWYPNAPRIKFFSYFQVLPIPIITMIMSYHDHRSLSACAGVNVEWRRCADDMTLWKQLLLHKFGSTIVLGVKGNETYKLRYKIEYKQKYPVQKELITSTSRHGLHLIPLARNTHEMVTI